MAQIVSVVENAMAPQIAKMEEALPYLRQYELQSTYTHVVLQQLNLVVPLTLEWAQGKSSRFSDCFLPTRIEPHKSVRPHGGHRLLPDPHVRVEGTVPYGYTERHATEHIKITSNAIGGLRITLAEEHHEAIQRHFVLWVEAAAHWAETLKARRLPYATLISSATTVEAVLAVWPEVADIQHEIGRSQLPTRVTPALKGAIKRDMQRRGVPAPGKT